MAPKPARVRRRGLNRRFLRTLGPGPWLAAAFAGDGLTAAEPPRPPSFPDGAEAEQDDAATGWRPVWGDAFERPGAPDPTKSDDARRRVRNHEAIRWREENPQRGRIFNLRGHGLPDLSADATGRAGKMPGTGGNE